MCTLFIVPPLRQKYFTQHNCKKKKKMQDMVIEIKLDKYLEFSALNFIKENDNQCPWGISKNVKISKVASKSSVLIDKIKVKTYIFRTKFLLKDSLTNALKTLVSKTLLLII
jgi:hypothetical protein